MRSLEQTVFVSFGKGVLLLVLVPNFRLRRKLGTRREVFHAARGKKGMGFKPPRTSCHVRQVTRCYGHIAFSPAADDPPRNSCNVTGRTRASGHLAFSSAAERYFCYFSFPIFAYGENWERKASRFHVAAGDKDVVLERPRNSCNVRRSDIREKHHARLERYEQHLEYRTAD